MTKLFHAALLSCVLAISCVHAEPQPQAKQMQQQDVVILLHGLGRSAWAMRSLEKFFISANYAVINEGYPSRDEPLETLADEILQPQIELAQLMASNGGRIHFVTHSMGGILLREWFSRNRLPELGRIVMLAPPNQGSTLADNFRDKGWFKWFNGPAGQQLSKQADSKPLNLPAPPGQFAVIAGNKSYLPFFSDDLEGEDDGVVSVEETKLPGMHDFLIVEENHTFIMKSAEVHRQCLHFILKGRFDHEPANSTQI